MPSYISTNFLSQAVLDALISAPGTSSPASVVLPDEYNKINSKTVYLISESSLLNIVNALRTAGGFTDLITPAQIPSYIKDKFVT